MPDSQLSAVRQALGCQLCGTTILVLTLESPLDAERTLRMLQVLLQSITSNILPQCDRCILRQQLAEAPADAK